MGAWGLGNFENDTALDWVYELEQTSDLGLVERAISDVVHCDDYLDADLGCIGLAAAEVLAALKGKPPKDSPDKVAAWVAANPLAPDQKLVEESLTAIDKIRNGEESELKQLWEEDSELLAQWHAVLDDLVKRLS
jgi:hypothetical protein